ncbi:carbohydrate ABC transporter permease [Inconstantimicrobium mannanitabidum]|uniref:ABC transporter permease n=1 Tax=Inconstantimicrobium mannanitabidum TaxID=1604901 RepID=A0ACB5R7H6_9CLOT|nr:sugar ABC transporter permease [Clostridium sp. TW13]GKX65030.1 ABC transporter permease [Clostridium sp. TW13]
MFAKLSYKKQKTLIICLFLLIPLVLLLTFTYYPALTMFGYSFEKWNGFSPNKEFVGLANYKELFSNPSHFAVLKNSLYYFVGGLIQLGIAFYFAIVLNSKIRGKSIFKALFFFPYLINSVAISLIFVFFFQPGGTLDSVLNALGLGHLVQLWLGNEHIVNYSLAFTSMWRYLGYNFVILLGAIQSVPSDVLEAADIDGAGEWDKAKYIILPTIKRIVQLSLILNISGAISVFEIPYIMTGGANGSSTFVIDTINTAFKYMDMGLSSAMAIIVLIIVAVVTIISQKVSKGGAE